GKITGSSKMPRVPRSRMEEHKKEAAEQRLELEKILEKPLIKYIEVEDIENPVYRRPRGLEQLAKATHFSKKELKRLYRDFKAAYPSGVIKEENFKAGYTQLFPKG
ncbi:hypothetical protein QYM36_011093, partial [Artemia franciscana]